MRLQQMLFAAFASTVLLIGSPNAPQATATSELTPIIELFNSTETTTSIPYIKQLFLQLTSYFKLEQMKQEIHSPHVSPRLQTNLYYALAKLLHTDDLYPSSYKGLEPFIREERLIIRGELKPINI